MKIVFATNNQHKLSEVRQILGDSIEVLSLNDIGCHEVIPETGTTLEANAQQKAQYIYDHYHIDCFADDTGLEVDALAGAPGVYSARYAAIGSATAVAAPSVGCAAAVPQWKRDRSHESREHGLLWSPGYNDHILSNQGELDRWRHYLADNPRRLFLRRQFPDLFRVSFGLRIGPFCCSAVGNRFLLGYPQRKQVQCSTHFYDEDIQKAVAGYMAAARGGAVLVSPAISEGEKRTMRTAFDARLPLILITADGLGSYSKPGGAFFDACAEGRLLILSPFEHTNRKVKLTRQMCMQMNELARIIAEAAAPPPHSQQAAPAAALSAPAPSVGCAAALPQSE